MRNNWPCLWSGLSYCIAENLQMGVHYEAITLCDTGRVLCCAVRYCTVLGEPDTLSAQGWKGPSTSPVHSIPATTKGQHPRPGAGEASQAKPTEYRNPLEKTQLQTQTFNGIKEAAKKASLRRVNEGKGTKPCSGLWKPSIISGSLPDPKGEQVRALWTLNAYEATAY